jgi:hypothetical protein
LGLRRCTRTSKAQQHLLYIYIYIWPPYKNKAIQQCCWDRISACFYEEISSFFYSKKVQLSFLSFSIRSYIFGLKSYCSFLYDPLTIGNFKSKRAKGGSRAIFRVKEEIFSFPIVSRSCIDVLRKMSYITL